MDAKETVIYLYEHGHIQLHQQHKIIMAEFNRLQKQSDSLTLLLDACEGLLAQVEDDCSDINEIDDVPEHIKELVIGARIAIAAAKGG